MLVTDGLDQKMTAVEASSVFGVSADLIRKWASLGKIEAVGMDRRGRKLYKLIDIARYEQQTRRAAGRS
jgi:predicted site-specific integrase-resolvase